MAPVRPGGLNSESQHHAVRAIRAVVTWLVHVRYLRAIRGAPWPIR